MKVVIDIDENLYIRLFDNGVDNYDDAVDMAKAIRKGTPLPKGHGRLVDADALYDQFEYADYDFEKTMEYAPTIIEADKAESEG
jgi:hypothetical protein